MIKTELWDDILIVKLSGDIDISVADALRSQIDAEYVQQGVRHLLLDLSEVEFMDSTGLGLILGRYKKVMAAGGRTYIVRPRARVKQLLEMSGVNNLIPVYTSLRQVINR
ncbi:MAG: anti-sigma factor antagonist [Methylocystaceae bacterium]